MWEGYHDESPSNHFCPQPKMEKYEGFEIDREALKEALSGSIRKYDKDDRNA